MWPVLMWKYCHWSGVASLTGEDNAGVIVYLLSPDSRSLYGEDVTIEYFLMSFVLSSYWPSNILDMFLFSFISYKATYTQI